MNPTQIEKSKKRTLAAMAFLAEIPKADLPKKETMTALAAHLKDKNHGALPTDVANRLRKLVAGGTKPVEMTADEAAKLASKLPSHLSLILKGVKTASYEKTGMTSRKKKVHRQHVSRIFGKPRKGKLSKRTIALRAKDSQAGREKRVKDRLIEHPVRVTPPNVTQDYIAEVKSVAKSSQMFSVKRLVIYPDEQGQWWRETQYLVTDVAPLGFFGKPTGKPVLPKNC